MARNSGFGIRVLLETELPKLINVFEKINKNLELIAERLPELNGGGEVKKVTSAKKK